MMNYKGFVGVVEIQCTTFAVVLQSGSDCRKMTGKQVILSATKNPYPVKDGIDSSPTFSRLLQMCGRIMAFLAKTDFRVPP